MANPNSAVALPGTLFIPGSTLNGGVALPIVMLNNTAHALPSLTRAIDISGFNTLSFFFTVTGIPAGNNLEVDLVAYDPETGVSVPFPLGIITLSQQTVSGSYAGTVYLPALYASAPLATNIMPFYLNIVNLVHNGATVGSLSVTALKLWLSNA